MTENVIIEEGPIHQNKAYANSTVHVFKDYDPDQCRKAPDGKHDWSGPVVTLSNEEGVTCAHCGLYFGTWAMRCLP